MNAAQKAAWSAASGNTDPSVLNLLILGLLFSILFLWATWALVMAYKGWTTKSIGAESIGTFTVRLILLLVISIFLFAS
ncbi:TIGR03758 family integrating conjugative element protein [Pectobacterium sp. CHL-2024]|uniref:Membrane protein n=2 Tax=Pectobacterium TaxID=122277 RepID=A0A0H3IC47_PECPM|nr:MULTISPECIES: TIGR03758 family integrating conjugative element protein [Pectobacterium]UKE82738.1 TIGR03758 family integrating conjugative element protein [Pectobacterium sp. PL152]AFI91579.1 Putative membrane protein [Pectobacterium parmentieri]MBA0211931.1 TIGR03758 family integrating conjugative element protein [Pectobacterium brasiliense]MBS4430971.1 TIGR03758 family integrating conjugative element protein [Pectobacterium punjabense]MCA6970669.1 TIGR03758 family integrating conjugative 